MLPADFPPRLQERIICSISAAVKYEVPANIVLAIAEKEAGKAGQWVMNRNGTYDVGPMQFNTSYLRDLAKYGITANNVATAGCYSFELAAWRLRQHIRNDSGDLWTKAANYHSRTPQYNRPYRTDLMVRAIKWANWLESRFVTYDVKSKDVKRRTGQTEKPGTAMPRGDSGTMDAGANP
jgi:hypothetical protein